MKHALTFITCVAAVLAQNPFTLYKIPVPNSFNARSLDGSPSAFYFSEGSGADANNWAIYFQGGGWCYSMVREMDVSRNPIIVRGSTP